MAEKLIDIGEVCTHDYYNRFKDEAFPAFDTAYKLLPTVDLVTENPKRYIGDSSNVDVSQRYEIISINDSRLTGSSIGETPIITTFGDLTVAQRVPFINSQFYLGINTNETVSDGNPLISIYGDVGYENLLKISTGAIAGANIGSVESRNGLRYIPGYEFGVWFTVVYNPPTVDGFAKTGLWDGDNGFWIGFKKYEGSIQFGICRVKNGVEYFVPQSEFNKDKIDGSGLSKFNIDPSKGNVYLIRGGYLGYAPIVFSVKLPSGKLLIFHVIEYPNTNEQTHISNTNLPVRTAIDNGSINEEVFITVGSISAFVTDGSNADANIRKFSNGLSGVLIAGTFSRRILISFRNEGTFSGGLLPTLKNHRINAILDFLSITLDGQNKPVLLEILMVPLGALNSGTFIPVDPNSILEYSQDAAYDFVSYPPIIAFTNSFKSNVADKIELFMTVLKLSLRPSCHAVFVLTSDSTQALDYVFSNAWSELW